MTSQDAEIATASTPARTPLYDLHARHGAKFVPFAGYEMPVQYRGGVLAEHLHTRRAAGLFDVSHMGQIRIEGTDSAAALETLVPGDITGLGLDRTRYTLLLNDEGGIRDDLMVTRRGDHLHLVVNAATKSADIAHLQLALPNGVRARLLGDRALLALQGPAAAEVISGFAPELGALAFMQTADARVGGIPVLATRSGYTGDDGFELSAADADAERLAELLLGHPAVMLIGLGARDSLRLEAGLCLYGHDIDETTTPIEAALAWTIGKRRRAEANFPGARRILGELAEGPARLRVGILPDGKAPAREGTPIEIDGTQAGQITSGGFGPSVGHPIAMGYVPRASASPGTVLALGVRGVPRPARVVPLPFHPHRYHRSATTL